MAHTALDDIAEVEEHVSWEPARWAQVLIGVLTGLFMFLAILGPRWALVGVLAALILVAVLLRRCFINVDVRDRPRQSNPAKEPRTRLSDIAPVTVVFWPVVLNVLPEGNIVVGIIVGILAGVHLGWVAGHLGNRNTPESNSAPEFDPLFSSAEHLRICAALVGAKATEGRIDQEMKESTLREHVEASGDDVATLSSAGYLDRHREFGTSRAKDTYWVSLTQLGLDAYCGHVGALRELAKR